MAVVAVTGALLGSACGGHGNAGHETDGGGAVDLAFSGDLPFLPGFDYDSGALPAGSPVTVEAKVSAGGGVSVAAHGTSDGQNVTPVAGTGDLDVKGSVTFEISAHIDTAGVTYDGVVDSFDYSIDEAKATFDPFSLDAEVPVTSMLPAKKLGSVPIPSVPGATLTLSITGGQITTAFGGDCAQHDDTYAQYTGHVTTNGTIKTAASIDIDVPLVGTKTFGPFEIDVPVPETTTALDLGTLALATGDKADSMGLCAISNGTATGTGGSATATSGADASAGSVGTGGGSGTGSPGTTTGTSGAMTTTASTSPTSTTGGGGDPAYPSPFDGCPSGDIAVMLGTSQTNGVCLPPCNGDLTCPQPATGSAVPECAYNPNSTYASCATDSDCTTSPETCDPNAMVCALPPTYCVLACDNMTALCPELMTCMSGVCVYTQ